jgi:hypothetical protein
MSQPTDWAELATNAIVNVAKRPDDVIAQQNLAHVLRELDRLVRLIDQKQTDARNGQR